MEPTETAMYMGNAMNTTSTATATYPTLSTTTCCSCLNSPSFSPYKWESLVRGALKVLESAHVNHTDTKLDAQRLLCTLMQAANNNMMQYSAVMD